MLNTVPEPRCPMQLTKFHLGQRAATADGKALFAPWAKEVDRTMQPGERICGAWEPPSHADSKSQVWTENTQASLSAKRFAFCMVEKMAKEVFWHCFSETMRFFFCCRTAMARSCYSEVLCRRTCARIRRCCIKQHWFQAAPVTPSLITPTPWLSAASAVNVTLIIVTVSRRRWGQTIALNHRSPVTCKLPTECG